MNASERMTPVRRGARSAVLFVAAITLLTQCSEHAPLGLVPPVAGPDGMTALSCRGDVGAATVVCQSASGVVVTTAAAKQRSSAVSASGAASAALPPGVIIGGQGDFVTLTSSNITANGTIFAFDVTVQNLIDQTLGTSDGTTRAPEGVRVFFAQQPTLVGGSSGTIALATSDGSDFFTASGQPFYQYDEMLAKDAISGVKNWQFAYTGEPSFIFVVYVWAPVQHPDGWIDVTPATPTLIIVDGPQTVQLATSVRDVIGRVLAPQPAVTWGTADGDVATVDTDGLVTAVAVGTVAITATAGAATGSASVTVINNANSDPVAVADAYDAIGNVWHDIPASKGLLVNDSDPDGTTPTVQAGFQLSLNGGLVNVAADGSFSYQSPVGFIGTDQFTYTIEDGAGGTATAQVTITIATRVWYARGGGYSGTGGNGNVSTPFASLADAASVAAENETIYVLYEDFYPDLVGAATLRNGQQIIGQGATAVTATVNGLSQTLLPAGSTPTIGLESPGSAITLGTNNTIRNVNVTTTAGAGITGSSFGTLTLSDVSLAASGGPALNLTTGTLNATAGISLSSTNSTTTGLSLTGVEGTLTTAGGTISTAAGATAGVNISGGTVAVTLTPNLSNSAGRLVSVSGHSDGAINIQGSLNGAGGTGTGILVQNNPSGAITFSGASKTLSTGANAAVTISSNAAPVAFTNGHLNITSTTGDGFVASGNTQLTVAGMDVTTTSGTGIVASGAGAFTLTGAGNDVTSTAGKALDLGSTTTNLTFATLSSTGSAAEGIDISGVAGTITVGTTSVTSSAAPGVSIVSSGSGTFNLGTLNVNNSATNQTAVFASSGGTVGASAGALHGGTASAIDIDNTALGMTLTSATSIGGTAPGIDLAATTGSFSVAGTGSAGSGGSITGKSGADASVAGNGVHLANATNVSLSHMTLSGHSNHGVYVSGGSGFSLSNSTVSSNGSNSLGNGEGGIYLMETGGASSITGVTVDQHAAGNGLYLYNSAGSPTLTISSSTFSNSYNDGVLVEADGTAQVTASTNATNFTANRGDHVQVAPSGAAVVNASINGGSFQGGHVSAMGQGITMRAGGSYSGTFSYDVDGVTINGAVSYAVNTGFGSTSGGGLMQGRIRNSIIGSGGAQSGSAQTSCILAEANGPGTGTHTVTISNTTILNCYDRGIELFGSREGNNTLNATVTNTTIDNLDLASSRHAIHLEAGSGLGTETGTVCANIFGNSMTAATAGDEMRVLIRSSPTLHFQNYVGSIDATLTAANPSGGTTSVSSTVTATAASCPTW